MFFCSRDQICFFYFPSLCLWRMAFKKTNQTTPISPQDFLVVWHGWIHPIIHVMGRPYLSNNMVLSLSYILSVAVIQGGCPGRSWDAFRWLNCLVYASGDTCGLQEGKGEGDVQEERRGARRTLHVIKLYFHYHEDSFPPFFPWKLFI